MRFKVGDNAHTTLKVTDEVVRGFAAVTGDHNPIHLDEEAAKKTKIGRRIAHGMIAAAVVSSVLGNQLPGPGTIYLSQQLNFTAPVFLDDEVTAWVTVKHIREDKPILTLETICYNQRQEPVLKGEAVVLFKPMAE